MAPPAGRARRHRNSPSELVDAGEAVLRAVDEVVAAGVEGHQLARREMTRREEAARRELFDDLVSGRPDSTGVAARAADFGLDLAGPHAVAIIAAKQPFVDGTPLVTRLESSVLGVKGDANALVATKEGALVVIFAAPDDAAVDFVVERLAHELGSPTEDDPVPTRPGIPAPGAAAAPLRGRAMADHARPRPAGVAGVFASYEEALDARELAARLRLDQPVVAANDLLVYRMLLRDRQRHR